MNFLLLQMQSPLALDVDPTDIQYDQFPHMPKKGSDWKITTHKEK